MQKKYSLFIVVLFFISSIISSQNNKSIHQIEHEYYSPQKNILKRDIINSITIEPINLLKKKELSKVVFGYYPYWEYSKNAHKNFDYNLLTHIALFDFGASSNGAISEPALWPWTNFMNEAHSNSVKLIMVVVNFKKAEIHNIITNSTARWLFMNGVKAKIKQYNLDGVNIDFERLDISDRGSRINNFMQELSDTVHNISSELEVSFAAPAVNWGGWKLDGLAASCDYLFVMGYDFFGSWSSITGPTAPLVGNSYNITNTINEQYGTVVNSTPDKIILGVPYFGPHWETKSNQEGADILYDLNNQGEKIYRYQVTFFKDTEEESHLYGVKWSSKHKNSWYTFKQGNTHHQVWFDNVSSLSLKYDLAISRNLRGIGIWALGYDGRRNELWDLIEQKFVQPVSIEKENKTPKEIRLYQNYPNPFNPTTAIRYSIPVGIRHALFLQNVQLRVFNVLSKEVATLVNKVQSSGNYKVEFNSKNLPSGTYFYQLKIGSFIQTKKMILLK